MAIASRSFRVHHRRLRALAALLVGLGAVAAEPVAAPAAPVPDDALTVTDIDNASQGFDELLGADGRAVCFAFLHPACPLAQEYAPLLSQLAADFSGRGVRVVGVVCERDDPADIEAYRAQFDIVFPIRLDTHFKLAEALDATTTPEVVLVDRERVMRYAGRMSA